MGNRRKMVIKVIEVPLDYWTSSHAVKWVVFY